MCTVHFVSIGEGVKVGRKTSLGAVEERGMFKDKGKV